MVADRRWRPWWAGPTPSRPWFLLGCGFMVCFGTTLSLISPGGPRRSAVVLAVIVALNLVLWAVMVINGRRRPELAALPPRPITGVTITLSMVTFLLIMGVLAAAAFAPPSLTMVLGIVGAGVGAVAALTVIGWIHRRDDRNARSGGSSPTRPRAR